MAGALGSLVVTLGLDAAQFTAGLSKSEFEAKRWRDQTIKAAREVGAILGTAAIGAAGALAVMTKQAIDSADSLNKLSQKTGETAEVLSGLQYAFELGDVSGEEFAGSMSKLARSMSEAAQGSGDSAAAFTALGVSVKNADGSLRGTGDVLSDVAEKFASYADGPEKAALAQAIFGKSGAQLIPVLNAGAGGLAKMREEAQRLGIIIDTETARAAEELNDTITKLGKGTDAFGIVLGRAALPALNAVANELLRARTEGDSLLPSMETLRDIFNGVATGAAHAATFVSIFGRQMGALIAQIGLVYDTLRAPPGDLLATAASNWRQYNAISEAVAADVRKALQTRDAFLTGLSSAALPQAAYSNEGRNYARTVKPPAPRLPGSGGGKSGAGSAQDEATRYLEGLQKQIEGLRNLGAEEKALADIQGKRIKGLTPALESQILLVAKQLDQAREAKALMESEAQAREAAGRLAATSFTALSDETSALREGNVALRDEIAILTGGEEARRAIEAARLSSAIALKEDTLAALENAGASQAEIVLLRQQIDLLRERAGLLGDQHTAQRAQTEQTKQTKSAAEELGMTFSSAFEDAIVGGKGLRDTLKAIEADILRIITRKMVTEPLGDFITGAVKGGGGGGGLLSGIGSFLSGIFGGGKASGGPVEAGMLYRVNERRPEMLNLNGEQFLMMGSQRGRIDANPRTAGGHSTTVHAPITVMVQPGATQASATQTANTIALRLRRASVRNG